MGTHSYESWSSSVRFTTVVPYEEAGGISPPTTERVMDIVRSATALLLALATAGACAQPAPSEPNIAALKHQYLECDRQASTQRLDWAAASHCSIVSEQLLQRGFAGDFERLLAWWRDARAAATSQQAQHAAATAVPAPHPALR
jgi:hypothetical protein